MPDNDPIIECDLNMYHEVGTYYGSPTYISDKKNPIFVIPISTLKNMEEFAQWYNKQQEKWISAAKEKICQSLEEFKHPDQWFKECHICLYINDETCFEIIKDRPLSDETLDEDLEGIFKKVLGKITEMHNNREISSDCLFTPNHELNKTTHHK